MRDFFLNDSSVILTSGLVLFSSKLFWTSGDQGWLKAYDILSNSTEERYFTDASLTSLSDLDDIIPLGHLSLLTDLIACSFLIVLSRFARYDVLFCETIVTLKVSAFDNCASLPSQLNGSHPPAQN